MKAKLLTRWPKAVIAGIAVAGACLGAASCARARELAFRQRELQDETRLVARQFTSRIRNLLEKHLIAIEQMATFFANSDRVTEREFYGFGAATLSHTPLCLRLAFVDTSLRIRWVHPAAPNRGMVGFDVNQHRLGRETMERARMTREAALSPPLELIGGGEGFLLAAPVFSEGRFSGTVVCTFESVAFSSSVSLAEMLARYDPAILNSGVPVLPGRAAGRPARAVEPVSQGFTIAGSSWDVSLQPLASVVDERLRSGLAAFWVLAWLGALTTGAGAAGGMHWISAMASRVRSQGAALEKTQEQLESATRQLMQAEKMTALGELVAGVAHEINNPLSSIMGYSQLLMARPLPEDVKRRLETMHSEAARMARIVKNLLTFARKHPPEKKHLGLNGIIEKTLELKAYHFKVSQIEVQRDLTADLPKTMLDFHQMQQVFLNLLNNAEQAMVDAGRGGTIRITTRLVDGRIEARVTDDGPGIPTEILGRIFEPFFTTKREGKGTGLGLSLCYGIVQEHGGTIRAASGPGEGATFVIDLPVIAEAGAAERAPGAPASPSVPRLRILVIDDEQSVQDFLVDLLGMKGHRVDTASDVPEAIQKIAAALPDLIISDIKMPHGSGRDVYRAVDLRSPDLARRIIFTTGDGASAGTREFLQKTGNEILLKPFTIEQVEKALAGAMRN